MKNVLNAVDKVEIITLQDNYIDITSGDNSNIVQRAMPIKNMELKNSIIAEHGFSAVVTVTIDNKSRSMLFDFGFSSHGAAINAKTLGINLGQIEVFALSHGHMDHVGGLMELAGLVNQTGIELVVHPDVFRQARYIKTPEDMKIRLPAFTRQMVKQAKVKVVESKTPYPLLDKRVLFLGEIPRTTSFEKGMPNFFYEQSGEEKWDDLPDDTAVVANVKDKGLVVLSGCAHSGIINTVKYAQAVTGIDNIFAVMGGFHLGGPNMEPVIRATIEELKQLRPDYIIPTHCTGRKAVNQIERELPDNFLLNMSGTKLTFA